MSDRTKTDQKPAFHVTDRDYHAKAWYLDDVPESRGDALIEVYHRAELIREFIFPAYKIWNIAAHFSDIVDGEMAGDAHGYRMAAWNGITTPSPLELADIAASPSGERLP